MTCMTLTSLLFRDHATDAALLTVHNDFTETSDRGSTAVLILPDISAASDVADHALLLKRFPLALRKSILDEIISL